MTSLGTEPADDQFSNYNELLATGQYHKMELELEGGVSYGIFHKDYYSVLTGWMDNFKTYKENGASFYCSIGGIMICDLWGGHSDEFRKKDWQKDTCVVVNSTSKGLISLCIAMLVSRGLLDYDEPIVSYWPEFGQEGKESFTIGQLMSHQTGLVGKMMNMNDDELTENMVMDNNERLGEFLAKQKPLWMPVPDGELHGYHMYTRGMYLSQIVRRVDPQGRILSQWLQDEVVVPLGLEMTVGTVGVEQRIAKINKYHKVTFPCSKEDGELIQELKKIMTQADSLYFQASRPWGLQVDGDMYKQAELCSANIFTNARSIGKFYSECMLNDDFVSPKVREQMIDTITYGKDIVLQTKISYTKGGFLVGSKNDYRYAVLENAFTHFGGGGSYGWGDPTIGLAMSYVPNLFVSHPKDPRHYPMQHAIYEIYRRKNAPEMPRLPAPHTLVIHDVKEEDEHYFQVVFEGDGSVLMTVPKFEFKIKGNQFACNELIRHLTGMGHSKTTVPIEAVMQYYNTFKQLQVDMKIYNEYIESKIDDNLSEDELVLVKWKHHKLLQYLSSFGFKINIGVKLEILKLDDMLEVIEKHFESRFSRGEELIAKGKITQETMFMLFQPGTYVCGNVSHMYNVPTVYRVTQSYYAVEKTLFGSASSFHIVLEVITSLGDRFTMIEVEKIMASHDSEKIMEIESLEIRPMTEDQRDYFANRGRRIAKYALGNNFIQYGESSFLAAKERRITTSPKGRMIIDVVRSFDANLTTTFGSPDLNAIMKSVFSRYINFKRNHQNKEMEEFIMFAEFPDSDDLYMLLWPVLAGFSFSSKKWGLVLGESIEDIEFNDQSFNQLVLPEKKKEIIEALVLQHENTSFSGIISGKGEGAIFLLHGPPGCGKTLTCEAIAETLHRPLYCISMGELGVTPTELETNLQDILDLCDHWNALVLLDEADVYVEKRTTGEILRNAMVGVMLRLTEYYSGVLFFTSNRVKSFDPAFQSRVTIALRYAPLDLEGRAKVWKTLLGYAGYDSEYLEQNYDFTELAQYQMNGRQIKNAIQLTLASSTHRGTSFTQQDILETIDICLDFTSDFDGEFDDKNWY